LFFPREDSELGMDSIRLTHPVNRAVEEG
jgi:hypothetical protein